MVDTWMEKLKKIDRKILYTIAIFFVIIPLFYPIGLPIPITQMTKDMYNIIDAVQPGDKVLFLNGFDVQQSIEQSAAAWGILQHLYRKPNVIIVMASWKYMGILEITQGIMNKIANPLQKIYGKDWVMLGYLPGEEAAFARWASDFRGSYSTDTFGTPIDTIPAMTGVNTIADFSLIIHLGNGNDIDWCVRQIVNKYPKVKVVGYVNAGARMIITPWIGAGLQAGIAGSTQGAEYQLLVGTPYSSVIAQMDAISLLYILILFCMIIPNLGTIQKYVKKLGGGK